MLRILDILFSLFGLVTGLPIMLLIYLVGLADTGAPFFRQERVGRFGKPFILVKFRTMKIGTASVASHLADSTEITKLGRFLRRTKLDELPQLWNVFRGEMSIVGPRPCLFNQTDLIEERRKRSVLLARPGITGLAQVSEIDMSTPKLLAKTDALMLQRLSISTYFNVIFMTLLGRGRGDRIR